MRRMLAGLLTAAFFVPNITFGLTPNDPFFGSNQWYLDQISITDAWNISTGSNEVVIAVLDTGTDLDHPDLIDNIWTNGGEIPGNGLDDDHNGYIDDVHGWDVVDDDADPSPDASEDASPEAVAHGTIIAGLIGARGNNGQGITGINWNVSIMPVRMLNRAGSGSSIEAADAIRYAVENGADVINMSFTGTDNDQRLVDAVRHAYESGVVIVAALGNDALDTTSTPVYPACLSGDEDWVIGVAASDFGDEKSDFSNYGACADITAPGEGIFALTYQDDSINFSHYYSGGWSGTSLASPMIAAAAGLLLSVHDSLTPSEVRTVLKLSVDPIEVNTEYQGKMGAGRLNMSRAFEFASLLSGEVVVEPLVDGIAVGEFIRTEDSPTVYVVSGPGKRKAVMDTNTYFTYAESFDSVKVVDAEVMSRLQLAGVVLPKNDVVLVKIQSVPTVYALGVNASDGYTPVLREIETEELAIKLYGDDWADYVVDIEPTFFTKFEVGGPMLESSRIDKLGMKTRFKLAELAQ